MRTKTCSRCQQVLPPEAFRIARTRKDGLDYYCRACRTAYSIGWRRRNPDKSAAHKRLYLYGITSEQAEAMLASQAGLCAICRQPLTLSRSDKSLPTAHVDHDHRTGTVRGLLCYACNHGLGHFKDSVSLLRSAALYLEIAQVKEAQTNAQEG